MQPAYQSPPAYQAPPPGSTLPPPPGTPGYGYGYTPHGGVGQGKPIGGLATALSILLAITAVLALAVAGALANRASVLEDGAFSDIDEVTDADNLAAGTAGLYLLAFLATVVLWLVWHFRFAKNAEALGKRDGLSAGWAIGGWFIPLANLVLGPLQLHQSTKASDPDAPGGQGRVPGILIAWWVFLVAQTLISLGSGRFGSSGDAGQDIDLEEFRSADQLGSVGMFLTMVSAVLAVIMVRQISNRQRQAFANRGMPI